MTIKRFFPHFIISKIRKARSYYHKYKLNNSLRGNKEQYLSLYREVKEKRYPEIDNFIGDSKIDETFINELALLTQITIKGSDLNYQHGRIIYFLLENYIKKNENLTNHINLLDIGTARGFSSIIMSKIMSEHDYISSIFTFDILPHNKKMYWNCIADTQYGKQTRDNLLKSYKALTKKITFITGTTKEKLKNIKVDRINFAFVDGSHEYEDVSFEYEYISNRQTKGDIIFFDDVTENKFNGIVKLINEISLTNTYNITKLQSSEHRGYAIAEKK